MVTRPSIRRVEIKSAVQRAGLTAHQTRELSRPATDCADQLPAQLTCRILLIMPKGPGSFLTRTRLPKMPFPPSAAIRTYLTRDVGTASLARGCTGQKTVVQAEKFNDNQPRLDATQLSTAGPGISSHAAIFFNKQISFLRSSFVNGAKVSSFARAPFCIALLIITRPLAVRSITILRRSSLSFETDISLRALRRLTTPTIEAESRATERPRWFCEQGPVALRRANAANCGWVRPNAIFLKKMSVCRCMASRNRNPICSSRS